MPIYDRSLITYTDDGKKLYPVITVATRPDATPLEISEMQHLAPKDCVPYEVCIGYYPELVESLRSSTRHEDT